MKSIRMPARPGCFAAVAAMTILSFATQALYADDARRGTWSGSVHKIKDDKQEQDVGTQVDFEWATSDPASKDNRLRFHGNLACGIIPQYAGNADGDYHFTVAPQADFGRGPCEKFDEVVLKLEAGQMKLTVISNKKPLMEGSLQRKEDAAKHPTR